MLDNLLGNIGLSSDRINGRETTADIQQLFHMQSPCFLGIDKAVRMLTMIRLLRCISIQIFERRNSLGEKMTPYIIFFLFLIITSGIFSYLEIQAEGPNGWAAKFPTWRIENQWTRKIYGNKPLTGYHVSFMLFMVAIVHLPFGLDLVGFSWPYELRIISFLILFFIIEDFLWFVFNPAFGIRKFKAQYIWWHAPGWLWIMPRDYWIFTPIGVVLYILSFHV